VPAQDGTKVKAPVALIFDNEKQADRQQALLETIRLTKAYAILVVEQKANEIKLILSPRHGAKSWSIPIQQSGDTKVLGSYRGNTTT